MVAAGPVVLMASVVPAVAETKMVKVDQDASMDLEAKVVKVARDASADLVIKVVRVAKAKDGRNVLPRICEREPARAATEMSPLLAHNRKATRALPNVIPMKISWNILMLATAVFYSAQADDARNLISNPGFEQRSGIGPIGFELSGGAVYRFLGDANRDSSSFGIGLSSDQSAGAVSCLVTELDSKQGKWFRFAFRGLPEANFAVNSNDCYMKIEFFGQRGKVSYDAKVKKIYDQVQALRRDLTVNGVRNQHGAEVWRTYMVDFCLPFPQVDTLRLSIGFGHGAAGNKAKAQFLVDDLSLTHIPEPPNIPTPAAQPGAVVPSGKIQPIGGRWSYVAKDGETAVPKIFDAANVDRLLYHDNVYFAPFAGQTGAWLREGNVDLNGEVVSKDRWLADNVTIQFTRCMALMKAQTSWLKMSKVNGP
jgi:hypothetical protein